MLPYHYQPLLSDTSIRLLVIHPDFNNSASITCTIQHVELLDPSLIYDALSYTWGAENTKQTLFVDNCQRKLEVRRNCYDAIRDLRRKSSDRVVWVDAVCIDQGNLDERSAQVRIMDRIYNRASRVIVHLGTETSGSQILFEELADMDLARASGTDTLRPPPSEKVVQELNELLQRAWFQRVWVLQEALGNSSIIFMCGTACSTWASFRSCIFGHSRSKVIDQLRYYVFDLASSLPLHLSAELNLWELLYKTCDYEATDPRDKIFALRSLICSNMEKMDTLIDYHQSLEEVFTKVAIFFLPVLGLRLLTAVRHGHHLKMSSWVPDWSQKLPLYEPFFNLSIRGFWADPRTVFESFSVFQSPHPGGNFPVLQVSGHRYAKIAYLSGVFTFNKLVDVKNQIIELYQDCESLRTYLGSSSRRLSLDILPPIGVEIKQAIEKVNGESLHFFLTRFAIYNPNETLHTMSRSTIDHLRSSLQFCRIFLTDSGHLGIASSPVEVDDIVCIIKGADSPCILRLTSSTSWALVCGDCHVLDGDYKSRYMERFSCRAYPEEYCDELEEVSIY